jgi:hypothetical protein
MGEVRHLYKILVGNIEGKRPLREPRYRWEDLIRMDIREVWWELWTGFMLLSYGLGDECLGCIQGREFLDSLNDIFSRTLLHGVT